MATCYACLSARERVLPTRRCVWPLGPGTMLGQASQAAREWSMSHFSVFSRFSVPPFKILKAKCRRVPKIQRIYGSSHFGTPVSGHRKSVVRKRKSKPSMGRKFRYVCEGHTENSQDGTESPTHLCEFARRYLSQSTPKTSSAEPTSQDGEKLA